jgi:hypothetical protein
MAWVGGTLAIFVLDTLSIGRHAMLPLDLTLECYSGGIRFECFVRLESVNTVFCDEPDSLYFALKPSDQSTTTYKVIINSTKVRLTVEALWQMYCRLTKQAGEIVAQNGAELEAIDLGSIGCYVT